MLKNNIKLKITRYLFHLRKTAWGVTADCLVHHKSQLTEATVLEVHNLHFLSWTASKLITELVQHLSCIDGYRLKSINNIQLHISRSVQLRKTAVVPVFDSIFQNH